MKLAGLDFETANGRPGSICSAGCAIIEDGVLLAQNEWRVRPHSTVDWMSKICYDVHGISYWSLRQEPEFSFIWQSLRRMLCSADFVVIHNAPFDLRHLRRALELYNLPPVSFPYVCSLAISRCLFPNLESHSLDVVANHLGFSFQHHNAMEDAYACANIVAATGVPDGFQKQFEYL